MSPLVWHTATMVAAILPDLDRLDISALKALVVEQHGQRQQASLAHLEALSAQGHEIERLRLIIEKLKRMMFGSRSEKVSLQIEQLELHLEELETAQAAAEASVEVPEAEAKTKTSRRPLPAHLPREIVTHLPGQDCCPGCGDQLRSFGEDVAEILEYIPANFKVIRHVRPKFACTVRACGPSACANARDRAWPRRTGIVGACARRKICRSLPVVPPGRDLRSRGR